MKLSYQWLKEYLPNLPDPGQVADLITSHVAEVESVHSQADLLAQVVVGKITNVQPHPNADKLRLCMVDVGSEVVQVVCGGRNLAIGQMVAVAQPGAQVRWHGETMQTLTPTTIRGQKSNGMICASVELGLEQLFPAKDEREIIDLGEINQPAGTALAEALQLTDTTIEIDNKTLTHRPDLFCHIGFARELAVILDHPLQLPALPVVEGQDALPFKVTVTATDDCRRYVGLVMDHIVVQPSPDWLQRRLLAVGLRPINNVVDITNYVMLEYGQPLHAFDYDQLAGHEIRVRRATDDETLTTLDGKKHQLPNSVLVITDAKQPQALAGIMGGAASEITNKTQRIAIESANFNPTTIRLGAQQLTIRTDGSTRHEKNLPLIFPELGMWRAVQLLQDLAQAKVASAVSDIRTADQPHPAIMLRLDNVCRLMGTEVSVEFVQKTLTALGCTVTGSDEFTVVPPLHRTDLLIPEELVEEVARIYGYTQIEPQPLQATLEPQIIESHYSTAQQLIDQAVRGGAYEVMNYSFYSEVTAKRFGLEISQHTRMLNPMNPDQAFLRVSLRPNLLLCAERNLDQGERNFSLIEYGHVYVSTKEEKRIGICCVGKDELIVRTARGLAEVLGIHENITLDKIGKWYAASVEIDVDTVTVPDKKFEPISKFPGIELDISIDFPELIPWSDIEAVIKTAAGPLMKQISVFDVYNNALGIRFMLRSDERTLAMDEAEKIRDTIVQALHQKFNATHRY